MSKLVAVKEEDELLNKEEECEEIIEKTNNCTVEPTLMVEWLLGQWEKTLRMIEVSWNL